MKTESMKKLEVLLPDVVITEVFTKAGQISSCWQNLKDAGEFNSTLCLEVTTQLCEFIGGMAHTIVNHQKQIAVDKAMSVSDHKSHGKAFAMCSDFPESVNVECGNTEAFSKVFFMKETDFQRYEKLLRGKWNDEPKYEYSFGGRASGKKYAREQAMHELLPEQVFETLHRIIGTKEGTKGEADKILNVCRYVAYNAQSIYEYQQAKKMEKKRMNVTGQRLPISVIVGIHQIAEQLSIAGENKTLHFIYRDELKNFIADHAEEIYNYNNDGASLKNVIGKAAETIKKDFDSKYQNVKERIGRIPIDGTSNGFVEDIEKLINQYSVDNALNMHDFVLAEMIGKFINAIGDANKHEGKLKSDDKQNAAKSETVEVKEAPNFKKDLKELLTRYNKDKICGTSAVSLANYVNNQLINIETMNKSNQ